MCRLAALALTSLLGVGEAGGAKLGGITVCRADFEGYSTLTAARGHSRLWRRTFEHLSWWDFSSGQILVLAQGRNGRQSLSIDARTNIATPARITVTKYVIVDAPGRERPSEPPPSEPPCRSG